MAAAPATARTRAQLPRAMFAGRAIELATFRNWLLSGARLPAILDLHGPAGIGKTALIGAFERVAVEQGGRSTPSMRVLDDLEATDYLDRVVEHEIRPALEDGVKVVVAHSRSLPSAWTQQLSDPLLTISLPLHALGTRDALARLEGRGIADADAAHLLLAAA